MNKRQQAQATFQTGQTVKVTNHYITRKDHPCHGTRLDVVDRATTGGIHLHAGGFAPWPKMANLEIGEGRLAINELRGEARPFLVIEAA